MAQPLRRACATRRRDQPHITAALARAGPGIIRGRPPVPWEGPVKTRPRWFIAQQEMLLAIPVIVVLAALFIVPWVILAVALAVLIFGAWCFLAVRVART